jgi:hypothetical protein
MIMGRPSEEDDKEDETNLLEEEDNHEGVRVSPILEDLIRHVDDPHFPGSRHAEMTRLWACELSGHVWQQSVQYGS